MEERCLQNVGLLYKDVTFCARWDWHSARLSESSGNVGCTFCVPTLQSFGRHLYFLFPFLMLFIEHFHLVGNAPKS